MEIGNQFKKAFQKITDIYQKFNDGVYELEKL